MGMATSKVRLNICGSSYVVNTSESEDYMKNLADRLNLDMNELMASSNSVSITTAAVMTALNYRDELEKASGSADNMRRQMFSLTFEVAIPIIILLPVSARLYLQWTRRILHLL